MHITYDLPVSIDDILEAKQRLAGKIYKTGMPRSNYFSERCQGEIFLKFENMQRTGSFKIRGAKTQRGGGLLSGQPRPGRLALLRHARHRRESGDAERGAEIESCRHL